MKKAHLKYAGILLLVVTASCIIHEFGHFITGVVLGNKMTMTLNMASPVNGYAAEWHAPLVWTGGPLLTLLQSITALILIMIYGQNLILYAFVLEPVTLRIWPYLVSPLMYQDEAKIGDYLGISPWILPIIIWIVLGVIAWLGAKKSGYSLKFALITILLILVVFQIVLRTNNLIVSLL